MLRRSNPLLGSASWPSCSLAVASGPSGSAQEAHKPVNTGHGRERMPPRASTVRRNRLNPLKPSRPWPSGPWWSSSGCLTVLGRFAWKPLLEALHEREEHLEHVLHGDRAGSQRERGAAGRAPQADGPGRRRGAGHPRQGPAGGPGGGRPDRQASPGRGRAGQAAGPDATSRRPATRPWPRSGRRPPTWPSRSPAGSLQGADRRRPSPPARRRDPGAAGRARMPTGTEASPHDRLRAPRPRRGSGRDGRRPSSSPAATPRP